VQLEVVALEFLLASRNGQRCNNRRLEPVESLGRAFRLSSRSKSEIQLITIANGVPVYENGKFTGALPRTVLRS
jgi:low affinity Fe/Cu permease